MILTIEEVRKAIFVDEDYDINELQRLGEVATSFIFEKTDYDFSKDEVIEPLAKHCAMLYVRQQYFGTRGYNPEHDYQLGIASLIIDLQNIVLSKKKGV